MSSCVRVSFSILMSRSSNVRSLGCLSRIGDKDFCRLDCIVFSSVIEVGPPPKFLPPKLSKAPPPKLSAPDKLCCTEVCTIESKLSCCCAGSRNTHAESLTKLVRFVTLLLFTQESHTFDNTGCATVSLPKEKSFPMLHRNGCSIVSFK